MSLLVCGLIEQDRQMAATPVMRRVRRLAETPGVEITDRKEHSQPASHVLSLWKLRLQNMRNKKRRFVGLPDLVRKLEVLRPDEPVKQTTLRVGLTTGLLFYKAADERPVGAVLSVRTEADQRRSQENWLRAMGRDIERKSEK